MNRTSLKEKLVGWGRMRTHNTTNIFNELFGESILGGLPTGNTSLPGNTCNECGIPIPKRRRFCDCCRDARR